MAVYILLKTGKLPYTSGELHMHNTMRQNGASINKVEAIKLSKVHNMSFAMDQNNSSFFYKMKVLLNYASSFELEYEEGFFGARIKDIVDDKGSSEYLSSRIHTPYIQYIRISKLCLKNH